jgi:hypothetical protein
MQVHHRQAIEERGRDEATEGDNDSKFSGDPVEGIKVVGDGKVEFACGGLNRRGRQRRPTPSTTRWSGDDVADTMTGRDKRPQRKRGDLRRAEVNEVHRSAESKPSRARRVISLA